MPLHSGRSFAFPVLVADIGGTNARFALVEHENAPTEFLPKTPTADHPNISSAIRHVLGTAACDRIQTAVIALAGPVTGNKIDLTNADWIVEPLKMIADLGLRKVVVVNDFEAQALALPGLTGGDIEQFGSGEALPHAAKFALGPGTGMGAGGIVHVAGTWIPVPGEGGHVEMGPLSDEDFAIWPHIERTGGRISAEHILSGTGMPRLARAVAQSKRSEVIFTAAAEITEAADDNDPVAVKTMEIYARALGRLAGDFALSFLARGGVYLTGGVTTHVARYLTDGRFRASFEAKAPHEDLVKSIPTFIVRHPNPALEGLAAFARTPSRFAVEMAGRSWAATDL